MQFPDANSRTITAAKKLLTDAVLIKLRQQNPSYYQTRKPIEVNSKTLGVPEGAGIRDYIKATKKHHARTI